MDWVELSFAVGVGQDIVWEFYIEWDFFTHFYDVLYG